MLVQEIIKTFTAHQNTENAVKMSQYMKNLFPFLGLKSPERRELQNYVLKQYPIKKIEDLEKIVVQLFDLEEREYQYSAIDILIKYKKLWTLETLNLMETLVVTKSWWDTVDIISSNCIGKLLAKNEKIREQKVIQWATSPNMWLNRAAIIHQLTYKQKTDAELLKFCILEHINSKEFFHQKAIGWALRQYAKYNQVWVKNFVNTFPLKPLSKREALKHLL